MDLRNALLRVAARRPHVLIIGGISGWYPYPFLDVDVKGWGDVLVSSIGITVLFLAFIWLATLIDRRVRAQPRVRSLA